MAMSFSRSIHSLLFLLGKETRSNLEAWDNLEKRSNFEQKISKSKQQLLVVKHCEFIQNKTNGLESYSIPPIGHGSVKKSGQISAASAVVTPKCDLLAWTTYVHAHSQRSTDRTFFTSMAAKQLFMISWKRWRHHALSFGCRYCVLAELYHPRRSCVVSTTWATPETSLSQSFIRTDQRISSKSFWTYLSGQGRVFERKPSVPASQAWRTSGRRRYIPHGQEFSPCSYEDGRFDLEGCPPAASLANACEIIFRELPILTPWQKM